MKLNRDEVLSHVSERHCMVKSDDPQTHSNSVEVTEGDMTKVFKILIPEIRVQSYETFYT